VKVWLEPVGTFGLPVWCAYADGYLYMHETLRGLLKQLVFEWRNDKHLVG
jgi:hypothetical protein